ERTIHKDAGKDSKDGKMGNDFSKGVDSAVAIITSIITGDIAGGLAGASAPWLAEQIKLHTGHLDKDGEWVTDNLAGNLISHAILGAVVAELQGNSGLAGGAGAVAGELANKAIIGILYGDKKISELSEEEKQTVSALSQLATGLAAATTGGNFGDASAAISSSKNAVENNFMANQVMDEFDRDYRDGLLLFNGDEKAATNYVNEMIRDRAIASGVATGVIVGGVVLPDTAIIGGSLSGAINAGMQYTLNPDGSINWTDVGIASGVGAVTGGAGTGFWGTVGWNAAGGATSSYLKDENPIIGALIGAGSSSIGYGAGKLVEKPLQSWFNPVANKYIHETNRGFLGITGHFTESSIPAIGGSAVDSSIGKSVEDRLNHYIEKKKNEKK
ncbi:VENN motif pre-toxin domain-containing protein, partial [Gilliamella sp. W8126]|uniref:VENN motif pre-toxin domain-containing protein n=1 Tax=Gilliamella sp. W8126 TaxID=2750946 RepID=UPI0018DB7FA9